MTISPHHPIARRTALAAAAAAAVGVGAATAAHAEDARQPQASGTHVVPVTSRTAAADAAARLRTALVSTTDLQPTGLYLPPDVQLGVEVEADGDDVPSIVIGAPGSQLDPDAEDEDDFVGRTLTPRETELEPGANLVSDAHGGVIYLSFPGADGAATATVSFGAAAEPMATFVRGTTAEAEFQAQLDRSSAPFAELVSTHAIVTVERDRLLLFRHEDHEKLLGILDRVVEIEQETAGYATEGGVESRPPSGPHHLVGYPDGIEGVGAYATNGYTAYPPPIQSTLLTVSGLTLDGWGPYHELGHHHQQEPVNPGDVVEVTVNIFSLAVQREFEREYGQVPRMREVDPETGTSHWDTAMEALEAGIRDYAELGPFEQLAPFDQLRLQYGDEFAPAWATLVRQQEPLTEEDRWQNVIYSTSAAAGDDLADFWQAWGVEVADETRSALGQLGLEPPVVDPSTLRESNL